MRSVLVLGVLAACGQPGLTLDIKPGTKDVASVEVFVAKDKQGDYMGLPPANRSEATQGDVYEVADTVETPIDSDGHARILLQAGDIDQVPALLVLGYNANHEAVTYAIVQDPNGPIMLRHTQSDTIVVVLDPATMGHVATANTPVGGPPQIVRWSAATGGDDIAGPCIGVIKPADPQSVKGTFFGPIGDLDCDNATPECDDNWFLKTEGAGHCVSNMVPNDAFMGACQLGTTAGCIDNTPNSDTCVPTQQVVCGPDAFCNDCSNRTLEMSGCLANTSMADTTPSIECQLLVADNGTGGATMCDNRTTTLDVGSMGLGLLGQSYVCNGVAGFTSYIDAGGTPGTSLALKGTNTAVMGLQCHATTTVLAFGISAAANAPISDVQQETWGGLVFGVRDANQTTLNPHFLVLPIHVTYVVGACPVDTTVETLQCGFYTGTSVGTPINSDLMWNCAGTGRG